MKERKCKRHLRRILPCLALTAALTLPTAVTQSKYVWQDTIEVDLKITYEDMSVTSLLPEGGYPSEFWAWQFTNIQAAATADGLILTAENGYTLPECITVHVGQLAGMVRTDGSEATQGISFEPQTGLLSIAESLIAENPGGVTVSAVGIQKSALDEEIPAKGDGFAEEDMSVGDGKPTDDSGAIEESKSTDDSRSVEDAEFPEREILASERGPSM